MVLLGVSAGVIRRRYLFLTREDVFSCIQGARQIITFFPVIAPSYVYNELQELNMPEHTALFFFFLVLHGELLNKVAFQGSFLYIRFHKENPHTNFK